MGEKILVPALGESITEATVSKWLKNEGDAVNVDEAIVELETDKVNLEVPSPSSGILTEIKSKDGDTVEVGAVLGTISQENIKVEKKEKVKKPIHQKNYEQKFTPVIPKNNQFRRFQNNNNSPYQAPQQSAYSDGRNYNRICMICNKNFEAKRQMGTTSI